MSDSKRCSSCGTEKAIAEFYRRRHSRDGLHTICTPCLRASNRAYQVAHRARLTERKRTNWRNRTPEKKVHDAARQKVWLTDHREQQQVAHRARRAAIKIAALRHYGPACACCGEYDSRLLTIEHANGDGSAHRRLLFGTRTGNGMYDWLRRNGYPDNMGLSVLCGSCNQFSYHNGGVCPHTSSDSAYLTTQDPEHIASRIAWLHQRLAIEHQRLTALVAVGANTTTS